MTQEFITTFLRDLDQDGRKAVKSEVARWNGAEAKLPTGRKPVLRPCPKCSVMFSARDLRKHKPLCNKLH